MLRRITEIDQRIDRTRTAAAEAVEAERDTVAGTLEVAEQNDAPPPRPVPEPEPELEAAPLETSTVLRPSSLIRPRTSEPTLAEPEPEPAPEPEPVRRPTSTVRPRTSEPEPVLPARLPAIVEPEPEPVSELELTTRAPDDRTREPVPTAPGPEPAPIRTTGGAGTAASENVATPSRELERPLEVIPDTGEATPPAAGAGVPASVVWAALAAVAVVLALAIGARIF